MSNAKEYIAQIGNEGKKGGAKRRPLQGSKIPSRYNIEKAIESCESMRDKALIVVIYLTAGRVSEVLDLRVDQIKVEERLSKKFIVIYDMLTEKTFKKKHTKTLPDGTKEVKEMNQGKQAPRRIIMIRIDREPLCQLFLNYINLVKDNEFLFQSTITKYGIKPIKRQRAYQIIQRTGLWCHLIRHGRLMDLVREYGMTTWELKDYVGWTNIATADEYIKSSGEALFKRMAEA